MSGCLSLCAYKMSNNIVHENPNPNQNLSSNSNSNPIEIKQEILSTNLKISSIRRTLSADMSNQKWVQNNGFPLKRVQSSEQLQVLGEEDYEMEKKIGSDNDDVNKGGNSGGAAFEDIWSSILSQKKLDGSGSGPGLAPAPYIHPLVKRSTSSLSEKSLEICTESLGSETGSDGLFPYPGSEHEDCPSSNQEYQKEEEQEQEQVEVKESNDVHDQGNDHVVEEMRGYVEVVKYNYSVNKKISGPPKSFPPPLPSLANRDDGSNLHMRTHREDGRLVLEAVTVPSQNCFRAQRHNGRLLLTLTNDDDQQQDGGEEEEVVIDEVDEIFDEVVEELEDEEMVGEEVGKLAILMEETSRLPTASRIINVHKSSSVIIMNKLMELTRNTSTWPRNHNKPVIKSLEDEEDDQDEEVKEKVEVEARLKGTNALPPRPKPRTATTAATALNAYEYYWRRSDSPTAAAVAVLKPLAGKQTVSPQVVKDTKRNNNSNNTTFLLAHNGKGGAPVEELVLVKAAAVRGATGEKREYLVPMLRGCKEPRKSLLLWEPYCIATS